MSVRLLTYALLTAQLMLLIAALIVLLIFIVHVVQGGPYVTDWSVAARSPLASFTLPDGAGTIRVGEGTLSLRSTDWEPEFVRMCIFGVVVAGAYYGIEHLKQVIAAVAAGIPFKGEIVRGLRMIGYLMLGWMALDLIDALLIQPALIGASVPTGDAVAVDPLPWSSGGDDRQHFYVVPDINLLKIIAGLFALAMAQAFAIGRDLLEENEAIV